MTNRVVNALMYDVCTSMIALVLLPTVSNLAASSDSISSYPRSRFKTHPHYRGDRLSALP